MNQQLNNGEQNDNEEMKEEFTADFEEETKILTKQFQLRQKIELNSQICKVEEFEKDNDQNYHIDYIHALANCRSANYNLKPMDWITTKLKAGKILPALATTTAAIAGLQTIEAIKIIKGMKFE